MTATNMCSNFGGFRWGPPLSYGVEKRRDHRNMCGRSVIPPLLNTITRGGGGGGGGGSR